MRGKECSRGEEGMELPGGLIPSRDGQIRSMDLSSCCLPFPLGFGHPAKLYVFSSF